MSIINDALKKIQKAPAPESPFVDETLPEVETLPPSGQQAANQKPPVPNTIKSVLALLCAIVITLGAFVFLYNQWHAYSPKAGKLAKSVFYKLIHKKELPQASAAPLDLGPLAQITVNPPNPSSQAKPMGPTSPSAPTLNIHGVMSNGPNNLVLINDKVYQEGDDVDGVKITKIDLDSITVINNGKEENIRVND